MSTLSLLLLACTAPAETPPAPDTGDDTAAEGDSGDTGADTAPDDTGDSGETGDSGDSGDTGLESYAYPWQVPGFWDDPGPLESLFDADPEAAERTYTVRMATSTDGVTWVGSEDVVITDFNSLDLFVVGDEGVILTGLNANPDLAVQMGAVHLIASADLETWASHAWGIPDRHVTNLVDPSLHLRADGTPGLTYYATDVFGEDPVWVEGPHEIRRAAWIGHDWAEDDDVAWQEEFLADPIICDIDGQEWLFTTQAAQRIVSARGNGDGTFTSTPEIEWDNRTVPFCRDDGAGGLALYAQSDGSHGLPQQATFDGAVITELGPIYPEHLWGEDNCSSVVVGRFREQYVLFCAVGMQDHGGGDSGAP